MLLLNESNGTLCLFNYYAIELLNSAGNLKPTQKEISKIENSLKKPQHYSSSETLLKTLVGRKPTKGKVLLIESDPFFRYVHYILLSNFGFAVEIVVSIEEVVKKANNPYFAVFSRIPQEKMNGWMAANIFETLPHGIRPKIYLLVDNAEEEAIKEHFLKRGADGIFEVPLNMFTLTEEFTTSSLCEKKHIVECSI